MYGKTGNALGAVRQSRSKASELFVSGGEFDPNKSNVIDEILARKNYRAPDLSALNQRPTGGTRVEIGCRK
jgi:hypothetical protein